MIRFLWSAQAGACVQRWLWLVFVVCALPVMITIAIKAPPGQAPDEPAHAVRAASLLQGQFVGFRGDPEWIRDHWEQTARVMADTSIVDVGVKAPDIHQPFRAPWRAKLHQIRWRRPVAMPVPNTAVYPPFLYVPAAIGIGLAHALGGDPFDGFRAARIFDALGYAVLGALALVVARRGQVFLLGFLLLPSALWLGGTLHPDGQMVVLTALSAALATRAEEKPVWLWLAALALVPVIMARPPLLPLAVMIALPLGLRRSWGPVLAAALPGLLWMVLVVPHVAVPFYTADATPGGPLWEGDPARLFHATDNGVQAHILLSHPGLMLALPLSTMQQEFHFHISEILGVVGALNLALPRFVRVLAAVALVAGLAGSGRGVVNWRLLVAAGVAFATILLIYDAEYINWTHPGLDHIDGVQGRYFLELAPLFLFAIPVRPVRVGVLAPAVVLGIANLVVIPAAILANYYRW